MSKYINHGYTYMGRKLRRLKFWHTFFCSCLYCLSLFCFVFLQNFCFKWLTVIRKKSTNVVVTCIVNVLVHNYSCWRIIQFWFILAFAVYRIKSFYMFFTIAWLWKFSLITCGKIVILNYTHVFAEIFLVPNAVQFT